jgi:hypothetical protein
VTHIPTLWLSNSVPRYLQNKNGNIRTQKTYTRHIWNRTIKSLATALNGMGQGLGRNGGGHLINIQCKVIQNWELSTWIPPVQWIYANKHEKIIQEC